MIDDILTKVADQDAPTTGTTVSSKSLDLGVARDIGEGERIYMLINIVAAMTSGGANTTDFQLIEADNADLTGNVKVLASTTPQAVATLTAGKQFVLPFPPQLNSKGQRYIGARTVIAAADLTGGTYSARIVKDIEDGGAGKAYTSGFLVK